MMNFTSSFRRAQISKRHLKIFGIMKGYEGREGGKKGGRRGSEGGWRYEWREGLRTDGSISRKTGWGKIWEGKEAERQFNIEGCGNEAGGRAKGCRV